MNFSLPTTKAPSPQRTTPGQKWSTYPVLTGATEQHAILDGCTGCTKRATHAPCHLVGAQPQPGQPRSHGLNADQRITATQAHKLYAALWLLEYCLYGLIDDTNIWNAGDRGDNPSQTITCEIIDISEDGLTLTLHGPNPKRIEITHAVPDPDTPGGTINIPIAHALREGTSVEFLAPSVLNGKLRPYITQIIPPASNAATATWQIKLSHPATCARQPLDANAPPAGDHYYCTLRYYEIYPESWPNCQPDKETQFSVRVANWTRANLVTALGALDLLNTQDGATRVLLPDMTPIELNAMAAWITYDCQAPAAGEHAPVPEGTGPHLRPLTTAELLELVQTDQTGSSYATTLDLTAFLTADPDNHILTITCAYRPEIADPSDPTQLQFPATCGNDQLVRSGSYTDSSHRRCMASADATLADNYNPGSCWQPNCSRFCLGPASGTGGPPVTDTYRPENHARPWHDWRRSSLLTAAWVGNSWNLIQTTPGEADYRWQRPALPLGGLAQAFGSGCGDTLPAGIFSTHQPGHLPLLGQRITGTDTDGATQTILHGLFTSRGDWTAGTTPTPGWLATACPDILTQKNAFGTNIGAPLNHYPHRIGNAHLYDLTAQATGYGYTNRLIPNSEAYIVSISPSDPEDPDLAALLRTRFPE